MVKRKFHAILRFLKTPKVRTIKGFSGLSYFLGYNCWARSQSRRFSLENIVVSDPVGCDTLYFLTSVAYLHPPPAAVFHFGQLRYTPI